jgi:hypothetical protein
MDPKSTPLATSLARLNILTAQITRTTSDLLSGVVFAPSFARILHDDVDETHTMVVQLQEFIDVKRNPENGAFFEITLSGFTATFAACALHLYRLRRQLKLLQCTSSESSRRHKLGVIDCAKWKLKERTMRKDLEDLQIWKSMLALLLSICVWRILERIRKAILTACPTERQKTRGPTPGEMEDGRKKVARKKGNGNREKKEGDRAVGGISTWLR